MVFYEFLSHDISAILFKFLRETNTLKGLLSKMALPNSIFDQVGANLREFEPLGIIEEGFDY